MLRPDLHLSTERWPVGLGFRLALATELFATPNVDIDFVEIAPENYLRTGGKRRRYLEMIRERFVAVSHGLSGDFAGAAPVDDELTSDLAQFLQRVGARWYSDHLCLTHAGGAELHDLVPLPFNDAAVERAAARVRALQEQLGLPLALENVSAYVRMPGGTLDEAAFVSAVLEEADCGLLLDINNVYVNAANFGFDPDAYIDALPLERVVQIHIAGHRREDDGLLIDTHGAPIIDPVFDLLARTAPKLGHRPPILLERDSHIPPLPTLLAEVAKIRAVVEDVPHG